MIAIIDYGAGNLSSVANAFRAIGQQALITDNYRDLDKAAGIVLPGVGAFGDAMAMLRRLYFVEALTDQVIGQGKPYLGICLGLQFLARESHEHGVHPGLGWIEGAVRRLAPADKRFRVPHIGWNDVEVDNPCPLFAGLSPEPIFYFVHSFHLVMEETCSNLLTSTCYHGERVTASVRRGHIFGVQFHPEKSQREGLLLLTNFTRVVYGEERDAQKTSHTGAHIARRLGGAEHPV